MKVSELSGPDLAYWVAKANNPADRNIIRSHYGNAAIYDPIDEPSMRAFVESKFGEEVPELEE